MEHVVDILKEARAKIADPKNWGQGMRYRRSNPQSCCMAEAIEETETVFGQFRKDAFEYLYKGICHVGNPKGLCVVFWNDRKYRTHEDVLKAFDYAIQEAEKNQGTEKK